VNGLKYAQAVKKFHAFLSKYTLSAPLYKKQGLLFNN